MTNERKQLMLQLLKLYKQSLNLVLSSKDIAKQIINMKKMRARRTWVYSWVYTMLQYPTLTLKEKVEVYNNLLRMNDLARNMDKIITSINNDRLFNNLSHYLNKLWTPQH